MTKCNFAHSAELSIEATECCMSTLGDLFDVIFSPCCVRYSDYRAQWSFRSNMFIFVCSFLAEILEKPVLRTGKCFISYFASLILHNQRLSTRFPKENRFCSLNVVHQMVKVTESHCTWVVS